MFVPILLLATMLLTEPFNKQELTSVISILYYIEFSAVQEEWVQPEGCINPAISPIITAAWYYFLSLVLTNGSGGGSQYKLPRPGGPEGGPEADSAYALIFIDSTLFVNGTN